MAGFLVRKAVLLAFLERESLALVWAMPGEKLAKNTYDDYTHGHLTGAFWLGESIEGGLRLIVDE